jgi:hypothetical protein
MSDTNQDTNAARPWDRATQAAAEVGEGIAGRAAEIGRRLREARLEERFGETIEQRPWTVLAVALGVGVALAVAGGGRERTRTVATSPEDGDDYLEEYEGALVNRSPRWTARARDAVRARPRAVPTDVAVAASGVETEWRPSDADLSGEHDPIAELGRGPSLNEAAMDGRITPDTWRTGLRE